MKEQLLNQIEKSVTKGEIAHYVQFFIRSVRFKMSSAAEASEIVCVQEMVTLCYWYIPREYRTYLYCESPVEDVLHFVIICPLYIDLRIKYMPVDVLNQPNPEQFYTLMSSQNVTTV